MRVFRERITLGEGLVERTERSVRSPQMKRRNLILLLGGASSGAMSIGTGAFSSMEAERGVSVNVVDDEEAFVGYQSRDRTLPDDTNDDGTVDLVAVANQFAQEVEVVDATFDEGSEYFGEPIVPEGKFGSGETATVTAEPNLSPDEEVDVVVTVTVEGAGVSAKVFGDTETRQFVVTRDDETGSLVRYKGRGTINVGNQSQHGETVEVDLYRIPNGKSADDPSIETDESVEIEPGKNEKFDGWVVAVEVNGNIYQHPGWGADTCEFSDSGAGDGVIVDEAPSC
ncbi:hypothetical protein U4E84_11795 [Halorubrum sp. AD140]|uniref:hypothetical protein n=1 Tax=Halorubrum sp. AD140 TaxID=3050073 RepID=UPI002ACC65BB|nr:hypothetical protein [Halorubrum sp. AD140]MDZ5812024.1 hypothetical protein [Halorubrum sp. AD140]